ncbi:Formyl transferase N-terminal [Penicillium verhagenii]|uniref:Formyl transferase N-terminal n=1 Tax=Penicillium verhagenii TaxID=1562060 RepID=UPI002544DA8C|nr:Formyl transferase N-terminal [Penicillium verhagenii]KAJ5947082.1 Formyl transferase N-terminal [Penicillium verhagenii]
MWIVRGPSAFASCRNIYASQRPNCRFLATRSYEPLRILFCGSDEFSIASLKALHAYHLKQPSRIASIDVVCRPGKRVGRGLKKIREVPIKEVASALSLPIHEIDTFTGWTPPVTSNGPVNLIIAVSFGLFVPPRILNAASYGGLNVHPSLLPDFRGPAPLHHTLLAGRSTTGVTLQTLHHKNFDHGTILSQTPSPGFEIPSSGSCTVPELVGLVAPQGAEILVNGIENGLFVPPVENAGWRASEGTDDLIHAGKIKPEDRHIDWTNWSLLDINRRNTVLESLWSKALIPVSSTDGPVTFTHKRVILTEIEEVEPPKGSDSFSVVPGLPFANAAHPVEPKKGRALYVFAKDGKLLRINKMKVEGEPSADGLRAAIKARMFGDQSFQSGGMDFTPFRNPLS